MKRIIVDVPGLYGDHHVLLLRSALLATPGVTDVVASAARRRVAVSFDETTTSPDSIKDALVSAGYPPEPVEPQQFPKRHTDDSGWYTLPDRKTATERKDREMAGDFRRY